MATDALRAFESRLAELDVSVTTVEPASFQERVDETVEQPAVGVRLADTLGNDGLSLSETSVSVDPTPVELREATTGITSATCGVSDYGSLVLRMTDTASELVSLFVEQHVVVLREREVVEEMETALDDLAADFAETRGSAVIATGPSATADMGALVRGAHGPREVHVLLLAEGE